MFSQKVCSETLHRLEQAFTPNFEVQEHTIDEVDEMTRRLSQIYDVKGGLTRRLEEEESRFIINERLLTQSSFRYACERYFLINKGGAKLGRMYPLLETQIFILDRLSEAELEIHEGGIHDGLLCNLLKDSRQVGGSTFS